MGRLLRVLMVEDAPDDAQLIVIRLEQGGFDVQFQRVDSAQAMCDALEGSPWDIIICDYVMPGFSGLQALKILKEKGTDTPFLMISGKVGEEAAAEAIRCGADGFLLKGNLTGLVPAVQRGLADAALREQNRRHEQELKDKLSFIQILIDTLPTPIFYNDPNGLYLGCNKAFEEQIGMKRGESINKSIYDILPPDLAALYTRGEEVAESGSGPRSFEGTITCADGEERDVIFYSASFSNSGSTDGGVVGALLDISERKRAETKLRYLSTHDMLTGIYNRAYFDEELERLKKGRKFPVSIVMADVDCLKEANDRYGHAAGDELLKQAAEVLKSAFRREDVAARIGGDEFAALLPNTDEAALVEAMERLQQQLLLSNKEHHGFPLTLSLSTGAATALNGEELSAAWRVADQRMYREKKGRSAGTPHFRQRHISV
ncbi:response receiver sensor diguanylate cyclase, PAS domain-containing [Citrifermentans bemidjiense Bem]|uniref:Response receiver sensor diguanylate cyclase, PAS domain-containing n=2 Tax=Citrifermentans bemidjiense TaxID=225194 RepID=B5EBN6_CITBB|nr:response receiver sensor diguanylate cyclase, PAS domain-containing [Citrifermentans bemidjiense Bem]